MKRGRIPLQRGGLFQTYAVLDVKRGLARVSQLEAWQLLQIQFDVVAVAAGVHCCCCCCCCCCVRKMMSFVCLYAIDAKVIDANSLIKFLNGEDFVNRN